MSESMKEQFARVVRVLLAFTLVFWGSFSVESLAFAQVNNPEAGTIEDHAEDELSDFAVYEVDSNPAEDNATGLGECLAKASDESDAKVKMTFEKPGEACDLVAIPAWNGKKFAISDSAVEIANFVEWDVQCVPEGCASIEADEDNPGLATLTGNAAGEVTVTCALSKAAKKKLAVSDELGVDAEAAFKVVVNEPTPVEPEISKRVSELRVLDEQGNLLTGSSQGALVLPKSAIGTPYTFKVEIKVSEITDDGAEESATYNTLEEAREAGVEITWSITTGEDIAEITQDGVFTFLEEGAAIVHVDASVGSETVPADITVKTKGAADPGSGDEPEPTPLTPVEQGEANPQTVLKVVSNMRVEASDDGGDTSGDSAKDDAGKNGKASKNNEASSRSSASASSASGNSSDSSADPTATETLEKDYTLSDLEALGVARATYTMYDADGKYVTVTGEGPYLIALLRDIGIENTEQVDSITFENVKGDKTTVNWSDFESANLSYPYAYKNDLQDPVSSSAMIALKSLVRGYGDGTGEGLDTATAGDDSEGDAAGDDDATNANENANENNAASTDESEDNDAPAGNDEKSSSASSSSASPEASSSASAPSASAGESSGASAPTDATPREITTDVDLIDNTCMRILFGATSPARMIANPDALRWVNKITVNVKPAEEPPKYDTDISVSVEYVPVPLGAPAVFTALPNTAIKNARFDFEWEVSTNNGKTWKKVENGDVQGLRVVTTEKRLGNQYRVIMTTNAVDKNGLENVTVTSKPVTMVEGNGLAVVLEYDPPIAGQTAFFQTTLYGAKSGVPIEYTWEQSQDGGVTWTPIRGRTGSSLAVPTEPIKKKDDKKDGEKSDDSASDEDIVPITYIHVIAKETAGEKREATSQAVPLTVHVDDGEDGGDDSGKDPVKPGDPDPKPDTPKPSKPDTPTNPDPPAVTPIDDITVERGSSDVPQVTPTVPTENGTTNQQIDPSKLYINENVTEKVNKQQDEVNEYIEATQPGARWTSLSSSQATGDDVRNILADNPFAPFVVPMGLGITVAGGLEKFLAFRRQTK